MAWTTPTDRATNDVITAAIWNQNMGAAGNSQFLWENNHGIPVAVSAGATSTTSTTAVDLVTVTPATSISVQDWALITFNYRKTAAGVRYAGFGIKVNATIVKEAVGSATAGNIRTTNVNQAEAGFARVWIPPRSTANYGFGVITEFWSWTTAGAYAYGHINDEVTLLSLPNALTNVPPQAAITSVTIRAINETSSVAAEVSNVALYRIRSQ